MKLPFKLLLVIIIAVNALASEVDTETASSSLRGTNHNEVDRAFAVQEEMKNIPESSDDPPDWAKNSVCYGKIIPSWCTADDNCKYCRNCDDWYCPWRCASKAWDISCNVTEAFTEVEEISDILVEE